MDARQAFLDCLEREPVALFEAALWIAAEHQSHPDMGYCRRYISDLTRQIGSLLPLQAPYPEQAQRLVRYLVELGFHQDDGLSAGASAALLPQVIEQRQGQPLSLALIVLEIAWRLDIPLVGINFPGHFLVRVPSSDYLLDPCTGRHLTLQDCRNLLARCYGPEAALHASHLQQAGPRDMLQRLSRNLRHLHQRAGNYPAALKDAERVILMGSPDSQDHLARADLYRHLACPQAERYDLERALLLSENEQEQLQLGQRLAGLARHQPLH